MNCISKYLRTLIAALLATAALALATGCDYPEQGYYSLVAFDGYALPVQSWPLMVEELVDDTGMTYGFVTVWPVEGELVEFTLTDASDETRRAWLLSVTNEVSGSGELDLLLSHSAQLLSFSGAYLPAAGEAAPVYPIAGFVRDSGDGRRGRVRFNGGLPPLPIPLAETRSFELRRISQEEFEGVLGGPVADAPRRAALPRTGLEVNAEVPQDPQAVPVEDIPAEDEVSEPDEKEPAKPKEKQKTPPLGGRRQLRPR